MATKKPKDKATRKVAKTAGRGRPTKYMPAYAEQARKLALLGFTDEKMAEFFDVDVRTIYRWKSDHADFCHAAKEGKDEADAKVATSLYHAALGGGTVTQVQEEEDAEGNVITKKTVKELPANVTAQIFWLKNRQPHQWRDKVVVQDDTPPEVFAETARSFVEIMAESRERQRLILIERGLLSGDGEA